MSINKLPVKTWNWLKVNDAEISNELSDLFNDIKEIDGYTASEGEDKKEPLYKDFNYDTSVINADKAEYILNKDAKLTVIQHFNSDNVASGRALIKNKISVDEGAQLTLIQVQTLGDDFEFINNIDCECKKSGCFKLIQIVLGGKSTYMDNLIALSGEKSSFSADIAYNVSGSEILDMNYAVNHTGVKSESDINVSGVMADKANKLFRGTIDFKRGCAGAKGAELEDVLLLNEGVINRTVPLILCDEEDVEGSHGATIGKPDENLLFYLKSRGINEKEIYKMMARAKLDAVANKISDERTRELISEYLDGRSND